MVIHVGYMAAIAIPCFMHEKEVSYIVLEQEETESQSDYEYLGLIGYLMSHNDIPDSISAIHDRSFSEFSISISDLKHSKPETPPPNC